MSRIFVVLSVLAGCCPEDQASDANPRGIYLDDATIPAMGSLYGAGLPRTMVVVGSGASIGDVDGDGDVDVVLARVSRSDFQTGGPSELLLNDSIDGQVYLYPDEDFRAITTDRIVYSSALADYDKDGDLDLFLGCAGEDLLLENRGDGGFRDVSGSAGIEGPDQDLTTGGIFADFNNDGLLDLYVTNYGSENRFYLNLGDKSFAEVGNLSDTNNAGNTHTAAAADLDHDGRLDLYIANDTLAIDGMDPSDPNLEKDEIYSELEVDDTGVPHFLSRGQKFGVLKNRSSSGIGLADFDADNFLDVYVTDNGANELYRFQNTTATYQEVQQQMNAELRYAGDGPTRTLSTNWGALPIDLDRDGGLELFVANGSRLFQNSAGDTARFLQLDRVLRQRKTGGPFEDITGLVGLQTSAQVGLENQLLTGRGVFHGDLDNDGDEDLLIGAFNEPFRVLMNDTAGGGHYVRVRLKGTVSAPDPIGALIVVQCDDGRQRIAWRTQGGHTYGTSDNVVEVACGEALPTSLDVIWPSGLVQGVGDFLDREITVEEPVWLELSSRVASMRDPSPVLTYLPVDVGEGKEVIIERSDLVPVTVEERAEATYVATLTHPGEARRTTLRIVVDGEELAIRPMIEFR